MISRGWNKDLNRVITDYEFNVDSTTISNRRDDGSNWGIVFHSNTKENLSFNGKREEFVKLRDMLNFILGDL